MTTRTSGVFLAKLIVYSLLYVATLLTFMSIALFKPHPVESPLLSIARGIIIIFATVLLTKYTADMFLSPWYEILQIRQRQRKLPHTLYEPLVSLIIPSWNEEIGLLGTVKTLLESTYRHLAIVV